MRKGAASSAPSTTRWCGVSANRYAVRWAVAPKSSDRRFSSGLVRERATLGRHPHRRQHDVAGLGAFGAGVGADAAVPVHLGVVGAFGRAGAAEGDAIGKLRFEQLTVPGLVGTRHDVAGGAAHRGAIEIEPNAADKTGDITLRQAGVGAGGAGLHAVEARIDAALIVSA